MEQPKEQTKNWNNTYILIQYIYKTIGMLSYLLQ